MANYINTGSSHLIIKSLWRGDRKKYPSLKKSSYELNLMIAQCLKTIGKDEQELAQLLNTVKDQNVNYMDFINKYLLTTSNFKLINTVVKSPAKEQGLTTYLRSLDREGIFAETFEQMNTMRNKVKDFGVVTDAMSRGKDTIPVFKYAQAYMPMFEAMDNVHEYFSPKLTDEQIEDLSL